MSCSNGAAFNYKPRSLWQTQQRCESQAEMQLVTLRLMNDRSSHGFATDALKRQVLSTLRFTSAR